MLILGSRSFTLGGWTPAHCDASRISAGVHFREYSPAGPNHAKHFQNLSHSLPKSSPKPSKIEAKWRQEGARRSPKSRNNIDPTKKREASNSAPHFKRKCGQHGPKLASQIEPKSIKNRCKNRSKNRCLSKSIFEGI